MFGKVKYTREDWKYDEWTDCVKTCFQIFDKDNNKCGVKSTQSLLVPIEIASIKNDLLTLIESDDYDPKTSFYSHYANDVKAYQTHVIC